MPSVVGSRRERQWFLFSDIDLLHQCVETQKCSNQSSSSVPNETGTILNSQTSAFSHGASPSDLFKKRDGSQENVNDLSVFFFSLSRLSKPVRLTVFCGRTIYVYFWSTQWKSVGLKSTLDPIDFHCMGHFSFLCVCWGWLNNDIFIFVWTIHLKMMLKLSTFCDFSSNKVSVLSSCSSPHRPLLSPFAWRDHPRREPGGLGELCGTTRGFWQPVAELPGKAGLE